MSVYPFFISQQVELQRVYASIVRTCLIEATTDRDRRPVQRSWARID